MASPASYYEATAPAQQDLPVLEQAIDAQVCIIGGGFAGLNTAPFLTPACSGVAAFPCAIAHRVR